MAINKTLIHFKTRDSFDNEIANGNILDTSIVFIQDTQQIWTHGQFYNKSEIVLYEVDYGDANFGTITLSDSLENYSYIEIYAVSDDYHLLYQKVYQPNNKNVSFSTALVGQSNYFTKCKVYWMSGNTISTGEIADAVNIGGTVQMAGLWGTHSPNTFDRSDIYIGIYKVVGYK